MGFFMDLAADAFASYVQNKDVEDTLKSLVFIASYKATINRDYKKMIANVMQLVDEDFSVFRDEERIDEIYISLKNLNPEQFFSEILSLRIDRDKIISFFTFDLLFIMLLGEEDLLAPQHIYNLSLIKKQFAFSRQELAVCYKSIAELQDADFDDTAEAIEAITSDEAMKRLVAQYPDLVEPEKDRTNGGERALIGEEKSSVPQIKEERRVSENPVADIEKEYYKAIAADSDMADLPKRLLLVDKDSRLINNALKSYAKGLAGENVIVQYDDSAFNNGKAGFLLTNRNLYIGNSFEKVQKIPLEEIKFIDRKASSLNSCITVNSSKIETAMCGGKTTEALFGFLSAVIPLAMQVE